MKRLHLVPVFGLAAACVAGGAIAQTFPSGQPLQLIVPFSTSGAVDSMARSFAKGLAERVKQQAVVINKVGAGGTLGYWQVARATPNGYVLAYGPSTPVTSGNILSGGPKFDQLTPVCQTHENIMTVVVRDSSPIKTIQQLVSTAKAQPEPPRVLRRLIHLRGLSHEQVEQVLARGT